jgi:NCS2 family nucleobase:cation symporter-2
MKPNNLTYGVDDQPPLSTLVSLGFQQVLMGTVGWVFLVAVVTRFASSADQVQHMLRMGMIVTGLGAILLAVRKGPIGSGYLCPPIISPAFVSTAILAGGQYGLPALFGMTLAAGVFELVLARLLPRLRSLFPPEVIGVVMTLVGIAVLPVGFPMLLADPALLQTDRHHASNILVGVITLLVMTGCTVWGRGTIKLFPLLISILAGLMTAFVLDCIPPTSLEAIANAPWLDWPHRAVSGLSFEWGLVLPFAIACIATSLANIGDLTLCQKVNDADWKRTDMKSVSRGSSAFGVINMCAGLLGTITQKASSSNIGLAVATGATSRSIAYSFGILMILCSLTPKIAVAFTALPIPILGAALIYAACFMILAGIQMLTSRLLDTRRILMAGIALSFGLSVGLLPHLYANVPAVLKPIVSSPVSFGALLALVLNYLMQLGNTRRLQFLVSADEDHYSLIRDQMLQFGESVAARKDTIASATELLHHIMEALQSGVANGPVTLKAAFDEYTLNLDVSYEGLPIELVKTRPDRQTLLNDPAGLAKLSGWLLGQRAEHLRIRTEANRCHLLLRVSN